MMALWKIDLNFRLVKYRQNQKPNSEFLVKEQFRTKQIYPWSIM